LKRGSDLELDTLHVVIEIFLMTARERRHCHVYFERDVSSSRILAARHRRGRVVRDFGS
jgi:hypothetical protein